MDNREKGFYVVIYTCLNCGYKMASKVEFGKPIPVFSTNLYSISKGYATKAPECEYCGCKDMWSNGKVPENFDK